MIARQYIVALGCLEKYICLVVQDRQQEDFDTMKYSCNGQSSSSRLLRHM